MLFYLICLVLTPAVYLWAHDITTLLVPRPRASRCRHDGLKRAAALELAP
jgi:hypothetical protein